MTTNEAEPDRHACRIFSRWTARGVLLLDPGGSPSWAPLGRPRRVEASRRSSTEGGSMGTHFRVRIRRAATLAAAALAIAGLVAPGPAAAQLGGGPPPPASTGATTLGPFPPSVFTGDLRDLPVVAGWQPGDSIKNVPDKKGWP